MPAQTSNETINKILTFQIGQVGRTAAVNQPGGGGRQGLFILHNVTIARVVFATGAEKVQRRLVQRILRGVHVVAENRRDGAHRGHTQRCGIGACGKQT